MPLGFTLLERILHFGPSVSIISRHLLVFLSFPFCEEAPQSTKLNFWATFFASLSVWENPTETL